eukprot:4276647-Alexandrium_andersonii.AAC.1
MGGTMLHCCWMNNETCAAGCRAGRAYMRAGKQKGTDKTKATTHVIGGILSTRIRREQKAPTNKLPLRPTGGW